MGSNRKSTEPEGFGDDKYVHYRFKGVYSARTVASLGFKMGNFGGSGAMKWFPKKCIRSMYLDDDSGWGFDVTVKKISIGQQIESIELPGWLGEKENLVEWED